MFKNSVLQTKLCHAKKPQPHDVGGKIFFDNQISFVGGKEAMGKKAGRAKGWVLTAHFRGWDSVEEDDQTPRSHLISPG